ncbi:MAG: branched-chain amino acid ABC transporter permease [Thermaerobacter sp.]|nr:branched-chain amino acid ABC transporter permease [Thermaerobacter sp.]
MSLIEALGATVLMYVIIYAILSLGLNLQYGTTGIVNFTYYTFVAIGAYFAGVTAMGAPPPGSGEAYILGWSLPFPIPLIIGGLMAGVAGGLLALIAFRRLRSDYLAIVTLSAGTVVFDIVNNATNLFNGSDGIYGVPAPWVQTFGLPPQDSYLVLIPIGLVVLAICWLIVHLIDGSPYGRTLRAIRDNRDVAEAFGKNAFRHQMGAMILGCVFAGLGGALTVEFVGALDPGGWTTVETFIVWAAVILGGAGSNIGVVLGALIVQGVIIQGTLFLPAFGGEALVPALRNIAIGVLVIVVMYFRPQGLIPERRHRYDRLFGRPGGMAPPTPPTQPGDGEAVS